jgi:ribosomal protein S18 acetylase RimI-like enzyme
MEAMIRRAKEELKADEVCLACHNTNTAAMLLYHKLGFVPFGLRPIADYENNHIAGILMRLSPI